MVGRLIPAYWLERLGASTDPGPLNALLASLRQKVEKGGGRLSVRCFLAQDLFMLHLRFREKDADDVSLQFYCFDGKDPQTLVSVELYHDEVVGRRVRAADRELNRYVRKHMVRLEPPKTPAPMRSSKRARSGAKK